MANFAGTAYAWSVVEITNCKRWPTGTWCDNEGSATVACLSSPGTRPVSRTGDTASCGRTAELGPVVVRPFVVVSMSGPRSQTEANTVAEAVDDAMSKVIRLLPIRSTAEVNGSVVKVAD